MTDLLTTREKLLDCAEALFADHGLASVSLRRIVSEAGVNVASVNYHFGSKDDLIEEVFRRRIEQVNQVRLSELSNLRARFGDSQIPVADLLRAFLSPVLRIGRARDRGNNFFRLVARAHAEPSELVQRVLYSQLKEIVQIFLSELHRSLPHLTQNELSLRLAFTAGAMVQAVLMPMNMVFGKELITDEEKLVDQLVAFGVGGMMSECPRKQK